MKARSPFKHPVQVIPNVQIGVGTFRAVN
jgi:hypothetical protein